MKREINYYIPALIGVVVISVSLGVIIGLELAQSVITP